MDQEDRIEVLEAEIVALRSSMTWLIRNYLERIGEDLVYRNALLALLSQPAITKNKLLTEALKNDLATSEAAFVGESLSEDAVNGLQTAQELVLCALSNPGSIKVLSNQAT